MNTKQIMTLLNNIVTNKREIERGEQLELSFRIENTSENAKLFSPDMMRDYTAEEVANLIGLMDVSQITEDEYEMLSNFERLIKNDNANGNMFSNEEILIGPVAQKKTEYEGVRLNAEFKSNLDTLNELRTRNHNLNSLNILSYKENQTDSKHNLDYVTIKRENGKTEVLPINDPSYLSRFKDEFEKDIGNMSEEEFYNTLKNSTEYELSFVNINKYLTDEGIRARMTTPKIEEEVLGYEVDEVKRQVEKFTPGIEIEIAVDRDGEVLYRAGDALFKGFYKDGKRDVRCIQEPSIINNYVDNKAVDQGNIEAEIEKESSFEISVGDNQENKDYINSDVELDPQRLGELMETKEEILNGKNEELKSELLGQIGAALKERNEETLDSGAQRLVSAYYEWRIEDYRLMQTEGHVSGGVDLSTREISLIKKIEEIDERLNKNPEMRDQGSEIPVEEEEDIFGFEGNDNPKNTEEDIFGFDEDGYEQVQEVEAVEEMEAPGNRYVAPTIANAKVRTLAKNKKNAHYGMTALVILIEMITVAFVVMMFLSLDI